MEEIRNQIARVARDLYIQSGQLDGHDLDFWLTAEKLVLSWYEPDQEREKHVGAEIPDDHVIEPSEEQVRN